MNIKINYTNLLGMFFTVVLFVGSLFLYSTRVDSASLRSDGRGIQLGKEQIRNANENLLYGAVDAGSLQGNLILLEKGTDANTKKVFSVGLNGDITTRGNIVTAGSMCFGADCKTSWSDVLGGGLQAIISQYNSAQSGNFWISGVGRSAALLTDYFNAGNGAEIVKVSPPAGKEGIMVVTSDYSPFVIRNNADTSDLIRVDQNGNLTVSGTINSRTIGTASGNIAINAGAATTNVGLSANYIEGHDWAEISNSLETIPPTTPDRHYFISDSTMNANQGGFSGLDGQCNNDANAISGRSYHVYAGAGTNREFRDGVVYSNKAYGTFATTATQSPDLCRVLGITCDTNWLINSSNEYIWNTETNSCGGWTVSNVNGSATYRILRTTLAVGSTHPSPTSRHCGNSNRILCLEDSGGVITNPGSICGNGAVEFGEFCDDGNTNDDAVCPANCQADGGYCGDGFNATDESCDYNNSAYTGRDRCTNSCAWTGDNDGDSYTGQTDCWNNDANAYPGSPTESSSAKDMNCSGSIDSRSTTSCTNRAFASLETNAGQLYGAHGTCESPCEDPSAAYCINSVSSWEAACDTFDGTYDYYTDGGCAGSSGHSPLDGYTWRWGWSCAACTNESTTWYYW
jgi:cysteine-rich repeat protein